MAYKQKGWGGWSPLKQKDLEKAAKEKESYVRGLLTPSEEEKTTDSKIDAGAPEEYPGWSDKAADLSSIIDEHQETLGGMSKDDPNRQKVMSQLKTAKKNLSLHDDKLIKMAKDPKYKDRFYKSEMGTHRKPRK